MSDSRTFVIVGAGQAGGWGARTLRDNGFEGRVVLIGDEPHLPYERPPLSKSALLGESEVEDAFFWPRAEYDTLNIELRLGIGVEKIDRATRQVMLADGEAVPYDRLLLATGARPRELPVPGADLAGIHYLRAIADTLAIRGDMASDGPALVVGGGWIGLEVAAALRKQDRPVIVVEATDRLCARAVTPAFSDWLLALHRGHGVDVRLSTGVERFEGDGRLARAVLSNGETVACGLAVVGIGVVPNSELAEEAGLEVDNGVVVDDRGRTSDPDIFAAGDLTNHPNALLGRRVRLESWENAQNQAIAAAKAMLDAGEAYAEIPWFWSDQYDVNLQLIGLPQGWDSEVTRGDPAAGAFITFYLKDGRIDGAVAVNNGRDLRFARRLMQRGAVIPPEELADPEIKMQALLKR